MNKRRTFIKSTAIATAGLALLSNSQSLGFNIGESSFTLPPLPYPTDALEPFIDKLTMEIHHSKHHKAYVENLNKGIAALGASNSDLTSITSILATVSTLPPVIRNNAGGHYNHSLFWTLLAPANAKEPGIEFKKLVNNAFGSLDKFKEEFNKASLSRFGSGWAWAILIDGKLTICSTPNQDNPLMDIAEIKGYPILALDVWEHAYYLKYQNLRAEYVKSFWNIINWQTVEARIIESVNIK